MLISTSFDSHRYDPILGSTYKVMQSTDTLNRLAKLQDSLSNSRVMRSKAINSLQMIGETAKKELTSDNMDIVRNVIKKDLSEIKAGIKQDKNLELVYAKVLNEANSPEHLNKSISKLIKDSSSILTFNVQKTNKGQNGPTHLISYTRSSKKCDLPNFRNYVVKWSNWNEICSWRLYDVISRSLLLQTFTVPKAVVLDFQAAVHENVDWGSIELKDETIAHLNQSFHEIVGPSIQKDDLQLMLMEKVKGSNLIDFAQTKYLLLKEEEKIDLFQKMGRLAMLDLLIGNTDRLIQTENDALKYQLVDLTANLGNLMINWFPNEGKLPELYAIDNGVKKELISDEIQKEHYDQFIQKIFNNPNEIVVLADAIIRSIQKSFLDIAEELAETSNDSLQVTQARFKPISDDLEKSDTLKLALEKGLTEMHQSFSQDLLPFWDSEKSLKIKNHLEDHYPTLLKAISTRFKGATHAI